MLQRTASVPRTRVRPGRITLATLVLVALLVVSAVLAAAVGQYPVPAGEVVPGILRTLHLAPADPAHLLADRVLTGVRLPRVALAVLVGAALAAAGTLMQAVFANPLADPSVVGVSSGAALGASFGVVSGVATVGTWTTPALAFCTGLATTLAVYLLSRSGGRTEVVTLVLTGIAVNAFAGAGIALMTFLADQQAREQIVFWQLGSVNGALWSEVLVALPVIAIGLAGSVTLTRSLDLLALGERPARHLGVDVERLRVVAIVLVALLVGIGVAFTGIVAFVGLVVPHLMRMLIGPAHGPLLLTSTLGGGALVLVADTVARSLVPNADLPLGLLTSLVGGPFFFWLLRRTRRRSGGWA
ncbi:iron complex transport system permease protein [Curtobacterium sp. PhB130]|uniref:FecCD family ABC transporter permease n=1 Tax=Curtobacterium sp. PhB130 TaxID=2485178 RepID=UPI000F4CAE3F|nr:iron ABC transporter permease [Curtobacterium sp. PhB130]ROS75684.1 iron complex transport system permease protein [Curtobacterium sp. PhB130]